MSVFRHFLTYAAGSIVLKALSSFITLLLAYVLTPEAFGLLSLLNSFMAVITMILGCGLRQVFAVEYFHCTSTERRALVADLLCIYCCMATIFFVMFYLTYPLINQFFFQGKATQTLLLLCFLSCFLSFFVEFLYQVWTFQRRAIQLVIMQSLGAGVWLFCSWLFIWIWQWEIAGMLIAQCMQLGVGIIIAARLFFRARLAVWLSLKRSYKNCWYYLKLGIPFVPSIFASWLLATNNRWFLARYGTLADVGLYAIADIAGNVFQMCVIYPLSAAYMPHMLEQFSLYKKMHHDIERHNKKIMWLSMLVLCVLLCGGYVAGRSFFESLLPTRYKDALQYAFWVVIGQLFFFGTQFMAIYVQFCKKASLLLKSLFIAALFNIILSYVIIPRWHLMGCMVSLVSSYVLYFAIIFFYNKKLHRHS